MYIYIIAEAKKILEAINTKKQKKTISVSSPLRTYLFISANLLDFSAFQANLGGVIFKN